MGMLIDGRTYTRAQIREIVGGGGVQDYLPSSGRTVLCGCFSTDLNPQAPEVVLAGDGPMIRQKAVWLCDQGGPIPVFLKRAVNQWQFVGNYRVRDWSDDRSAIIQHARDRVDVSRVMFLQRA